MPKQIKLLFVRHGRSVANDDQTLNATMADNQISLSPLGHLQTKTTGRFLAKLIRDHYPVGRDSRRIIVWNSPFQRSRQSSTNISLALSAGGVPHSRVEDPCLIEQRFGMFDGIPEDKLPEIYPAEHAHYEKWSSGQGRYYAPMPNGENRMDVYLRVNQVIEAIHRRFDENGADIHIINSHGVTQRMMIMRWMRFPPEWSDQERNPRNGTVVAIQNGRYLGSIFDPM